MLFNYDIILFIYLRFNNRENIHTCVHNRPSSIEYAALKNELACYDVGLLIYMSLLGSQII